MVKRKRPVRYVGVNDRGYAIGESHARAKLSDADIETILWLREQGLSYGQIARKFDDGVSVSKSQVRRICSGDQRAQVPTDWKLRGLHQLEEDLRA
ncbi:hypothetical protein [Hydrogenophaga sp.]|uniref:hypothetical protein n=1 Tax=Hydrogenophaga sp. TaxID=1904254 RepID=UPI0025C2DDEB|nr:hypothetical protein [Hydrogenophaga sp.]MBT9467205.1 hypothetical protein [Hydrogenophaga sp.]